MQQSALQPRARAGAPGDHRVLALSPPALRAVQADDIPGYLRQVYSWAYVRPHAPRWLDHKLVVSAILWGNYGRLVNAVLSELEPGWHVMQPACVYGDLSRRIAALLGPEGRLEVSDVVALQVENCRRKLKDFDNSTVSLRDAAMPLARVYDAVCCFFLLHEMPGDYKRRVVEALLGAVAPGGKVIFVDYHRPHPLHPLRPGMSLVFDLLEPFAKELWQREIRSFADRADGFSWRRQTYFGGLYQKTVATRLAA